MISSPLQEAQTLSVDYATNVLPLEVNALWHAPWDMGTLQPVAGTGLGFYFSRRVGDLGSGGGLSLGTQWFFGADIPLTSGTLSTTLAWNGARKQFGNRNEDGEAARETLATLRLNLAWLLPF